MTLAAIFSSVFFLLLLYIALVLDNSVIKRHINNNFDRFRFFIYPQYTITYPI